MLYASDKTIEIRCNFEAKLFERGKYVRGSCRIGHNVFTSTGRDWLAHLVAWQAIGGGGDVPFTQRRVRWMSVGTGAQEEVEGVTQLNNPSPVTAGTFLSAIQSSEPSGSSVEFYKEFGLGEISLPAEGLPIVAVTEAGLFVDVFPASTAGGVDDSSIGASNTTLDPTSELNPPVAYKAFEAINKTVDFNLVVRWTFLF